MHKNTFPMCFWRINNFNSNHIIDNVGCVFHTVYMLNLRYDESNVQFFLIVFLVTKLNTDLCFMWHFRWFNENSLATHASSPVWKWTINVVHTKLTTLNLSPKCFEWYEILISSKPAKDSVSNCATEKKWSQSKWEKHGECLSSIVFRWDDGRCIWWTKMWGQREWRQPVS